VLNFQLNSIRTLTQTTSLISAIRRNDPGLVQVILDLGANPNLSWFKGGKILGNTPLDEAVHVNNPEIIDSLMYAGATDMNRPVNWNDPDEEARWERTKQVVAGHHQYIPGAPGYQEAQSEFERERGRPRQR
jgi:hypothetical protein